MSKYYKAFNADMCCRQKQYKVGEIYEEFTSSGKPQLCESGSMHFCYDPKIVMEYYNILDANCNPFIVAEVEPLGLVDSDGIKACTNKLLIKEIINLYDYISECVRYTTDLVFRYSNFIYDADVMSSDSNGKTLIANTSGARISSNGYRNRILSSENNCVISVNGYGTNIISLGARTKISILKGDAKAYIEGCESIVHVDSITSRIYLKGKSCKCYITPNNWIKGELGSKFYITTKSGDIKVISIDENSEMKPGIMYFITEDGNIHGICNMED